MSQFIPELELADRFYHEAVGPILKNNYPDLVYSAALIGDGSGVLGYDTELSRDHDWGLRLHLFMESDTILLEEINNVLDQNLPSEILGYSVRFSKGGSAVRHHVDIHTLESYLQEYLGISSLEALEPGDWLTFPQEKLLCLTAGQVFHDGLGVLGKMRHRIAYYPHEVWLYLVASGWRSLTQEMPFVGRCADVGDEVGSKLIAARQSQRAIQLLFLQEKQYAPYSKWLGTALSKLKHGPNIESCLNQAMLTPDWKVRESHLNEAYKLLVEVFNDLQLIKPVPVETKSFFDRPYAIVEGPSSELIQALISGQQLRSLPLGVGGIDQITGNVDVLTYPKVFRRIKGLYS